MQEKKIKATFYLPENVLIALEMLQSRLRSSHRTVRSKITKSTLIEMALELAAEEFDTSGTESGISKKVGTLKS